MGGGIVDTLANLGQFLRLIGGRAISHPGSAAKQHKDSVFEELHRLLHDQGQGQPENNAEQAHQHIEKAFVTAVCHRVNRLDVDSVKVATRVDAVAADDGQAVLRGNLVIHVGGVPVHHLVDDDLMRHILGTEDDLGNLVYLNDVGYLREVADEALWGLALRLRTHQTDEIRLDGGAFQDGVDALCLFGGSRAARHTTPKSQHYQRPHRGWLSRCYKVCRNLL